MKQELKLILIYGNHEIYSEIYFDLSKTIIIICFKI